MKYIILDGKKRRIKGTMGAMMRLLRKYKDTDKIQEWEPTRILNFYYELIWNFLDYTIKPFITYNRFIKKADMEEIRKAQDDILALFYGVELEKKENSEVKKK